MIAASAWLVWVTVAQAQPVKGVVRERGTGDPIAQGVAQVVWNGQVYEVQLDDNGAFVLPLPDAMGGPVTLSVTAAGYLPSSVSLEQIPDSVRVALVREPPPPEVVVEARRPSVHAARHVLDRERVEKTPGTFDDPVRLIQALPGVAVTPEYSPTAGVLAVRGAAPAESRVFLDGVEVPYLYHFQNYASVVHSRLLDEVALYPSTFASEWGDAVGGIASVTTRRPDPARVHGGVNLNAITTGAYLQTPVGNDASVSLSGRRSIADLADDSNDQYTVWPVFWDYLSRVDFGSGDHQFAVMAVGAGDNYGRYPGDTAQYDPLERDTAPDFQYHRAFHVLTAQGSLGTDHNRHRVVLAGLQDTRTGDLGSDQERRLERTLSARYRMDIVSSDALIWSAGGDGRAGRVHREATPSRAWTELGAEAPMLAAGLPVDEVLARVQGGVWVEPRVKMGTVAVQPGIRVQGDTLTGAWAPEPRLSTFVRLPREARLRAAIGRYTQAPPIDALSPTVGIPELPLAKSEQATVGLDLALGGRVELSTDVYGRQVRDSVEVDPADASGLGAVRIRDARAGGVELVARTRMRDQFFVSTSAVFSRSLRRVGPSGAWVSGDYDQPFALNVVASWDFADGWNGGVRYRFASGLPYTPLRGTYDGNTDTWAPTPEAENAGRLPNYQKVDVHFEREWTFQNWMLVGYLEAWWVPPRNNAMYYVYSYDYTQVESVAGPPFVPLLGLRAEL